MVLTALQFIEGIIKIANVVLIIVAASIASTMFKHSGKKPELKPWIPLIFVLMLFAVQEILGALRAFAIWESPFLTHVIPTIMLGLLIYTITLQIIMRYQKI